MFNQAIVSVGVRYGVLGGVVCFVLMLLIYFMGYNPLAEAGQYSFIPIPVVVFLGIKYFKQFNDAELGFLRALRVGLSVSFYTALTAAMLLFIFLYFAGDELVLEYKQQMLTLLERDREEQIKIFGQETYEQSLESLKGITPSMLAAYDFMGRFFVGLLFSIVAAVFFRK